MYSPRRHINRYYSRSYNRKKRINKKFSPAAYKNNVPTYFQQKGRIIQTSPLRLYQIPRQLPNMKTFDNMYNILLKAKYPNVGPVDPPTPAPQVPLQPYIVSFRASSSYLYTLTDHQLTPTNLVDLVNNSGQLTELPDGWDYQFDLFTLEFRHEITPDSSNTDLFHIDLTHPIFVDNPYPIVLKTLTTNAGSFGLHLVWLSSLIPVSSNQAKITRGSYTT